MLSSKDKEKLKQFCHNSQNPFIYYDNDADGLCSFLLLRKFLGKGEGMPIRSYPEIDVSYSSHALLAKADAIFVLDKPIFSPEFIRIFSEQHIPVIWIDHHPFSERAEFSNLFVFNPSEEKSSPPVSALLYDLFSQPENKWIALMGCLSDHYLPKFIKEFEKEYPELWSNNVKKPFDGYYRTEIGKMARALNFGLKTSNSQVMQLQNYLLKCKSPYEVFADVLENQSFLSTYNKLKTRYDSLFANANEEKGKIIFFTYSGETSMSAELANELSYNNEDSYVIVGYTKGGLTNLSLRGKNVKKMFEKVKENFSSLDGGGHEDAVGARIKTQDLTRFKEFFENAL